MAIDPIKEDVPQRHMLLGWFQGVESLGYIVDPFLVF